MALPYIMTDESVSIFMNGRNYVVTNSHMNWERIRDAIKNKEWDSIPSLVDVVQSVKKYTNGSVELVDGVVKYKGELLHNAVTDKIIDMNNQGYDVGPLVAFLENLLQNPSRTAIQELYLFMEAGKMPITEDGCFLAYKRVRDNYRDVHSGKVLNKPANLLTDEEVGLIPYTVNGVTVALENGTTVVSMERNMVDDDRNNTCSYGLHFCSYDYLQHFCGDRIVVLKINPKDVVSIPADYNNTKGRTCRYEVIGEIGVNFEHKDMKKAVHQQPEAIALSEDPEEDEPKTRSFQVELVAFTFDTNLVRAYTTVDADDEAEAKDNALYDVRYNQLTWCDEQGAKVNWNEIDDDTVRVKKVLPN